MNRRLAAAAAALVLLTGCGGYTGQRPPEDEPGVANGQGANGNGDGPAVPNLSIPPVTDPTAAPTATKAPSASATKKPTSKSTQKASGGCAKVAKVNAVGFIAGTKIRKSVQSFRLTLSQGTLSRTAWTADDLKDRHGLPVVPGVGVTDEGYTFVMGGSGNRPTALPGKWSAEGKATMLIEGLGGDGRSIYQSSRTFTFTKTYPNGKACDKTPALSYFVKLTEANRIAKR